MLQNITDIELKMKDLIFSINQLQKQISTPYEAKKSNIRNSILIKIPKYLILTKITPYLTFKQCHILSQTCIFLRRTIYSPLGWKFLTYSHSPYQIIVIDPNSSIKKSSKFPQSNINNQSQQQENFQDYQDQQFLLKQRIKYKQRLWTYYKQFLSFQQKNQVFNEKLKIQKMLLFKKKLQANYFKSQRNYLQQQNTKYKQSLKKLTTGFMAKDQQLEKKIIQIETENNKLQKQKQALVGKIKQYQEEMPLIMNKAENTKKSLQFIKDFLANKNLQPLQDQLVENEQQYE